MGNPIPQKWLCRGSLQRSVLPVCTLDVARLSINVRSSLPCTDSEIIFGITAIYAIGSLFANNTHHVPCSVAGLHTHIDASVAKTFFPRYFVAGIFAGNRSTILAVCSVMIDGDACHGERVANRFSDCHIKSINARIYHACRLTYINIEKAIIKDRLRNFRAFRGVVQHGSLA